MSDFEPFAYHVHYWYVVVLCPHAIWLSRTSPSGGGLRKIGPEFYASLAGVRDAAPGTVVSWRRRVTLDEALAAVSADELSSGS